MNPEQQNPPSSPTPEPSEQPSKPEMFTPSPDAQASQPGYIIGGQAPVVSGGPGKAHGLGRTRKLVLAGVGALVVLGTAGYVLGYYLPNRPENLWDSALKNTGKGFDKLIDYTSDETLATKYQTATASGDFAIKGDDFSSDGKLEIKADGKNATFKADAGLGITRVEVEGRIKDAENSTSPDVYVKFKGIKGLGGEGLPGLDTIDDQWVTIDHTFFDSLTQQTAEDQSAPPTPSKADVVAAARVFGEVSKKHLFTDNEQNAVLKMHEYKGRQTMDGKSTAHYTARANKDNLKAYIKELGAQLDKTKLNDWVEQAYDRPLSELADLKGMEQAASDLKTKETFDVWVNTKTKLVHKVRFSDSKNAANYFDLGLNYDGGSEMPFFATIRTTDGTGGSTVDLDVTLNTDTDKVDITVAIEDEGEGGKTTGTLDLNIQPGSGSIDVAAPEGTITLMEALDRVGLRAYFDLILYSLLAQLGETNTTLEQEATELDQPLITQ